MVRCLKVYITDPAYRIRKGTVNPSRLSVAKDVKFRIFHGDADDVVPVKGSRAAYKALKAAGADVEYIEFPGCTHGSWNPAFNYPCLLYTSRCV